MTPLDLLMSAKTLFQIRSSAHLRQTRTWNSFCPWAQTLNSVCTNLSPSFECLGWFGTGYGCAVLHAKADIHFLSLPSLSALPPGVDDTHPGSPRFKVPSTLWPQFLISLFFLQTLLEASCLFPFHLFFQSLPCGLEISRDGRIPEVLDTVVFSCDKTLSSLGFPGKAQVKSLLFLEWPCCGVSFTTWPLDDCWVFLGPVLDPCGFPALSLPVHLIP